MLSLHRWARNISKSIVRMKLLMLLLFCLIEAVSLGIIWYDVSGSEIDLLEGEESTRTRHVPDKRGTKTSDSEPQVSVPGVSRKDTGFRGRSVEIN